MAKHDDSKGEPRRSEFWGAVKLMLTIVLIALIPVTLDQIHAVDESTLKLVGRIAVGIGGVLVVLALVKQLGKVVALVALIVLVFAVLVSEGIIDLPKIVP